MQLSESIDVKIEDLNCKYLLFQTNTGKFVLAVSSPRGWWPLLSTAPLYISIR